MSKMFRLNKNYFFLATDTILKEDDNGDYSIFISIENQVKGGIRNNGLVIDGEIVENTPDVFEDISPFFRR